MAYNPNPEVLKPQEQEADLPPFIFPGARPDASVLKDFSPRELAQVENITKNCLKQITRSKSYFRPHDVLKKVLDQSQKDLGDVLVERKNFESMTKLLVNQMNLLAIGETGWFTTSEVANQEKMILAYAGFETTEHQLKPNLVQDAIDHRKGISDEQRQAVVAACLTNKRVTVIEGTAGAGKSFTMQAVKEAYSRSGYAVLGTALSWNAAKVLESSAGLSNCVAIEGLVREMTEARLAGVEYFRQPTLLIVDEAGLVGTKHMFHILDETHNSKKPVKIVLTGDSLQLNPVDAGNALQAIIEFHGTTRIDTIRRQKQESHRLAVKRFSNRQSGQALYPFIHQEAIRWCKDKKMVFNMVVRDFISYRHAFPEKKSLILALSNKDVVELNQLVRKAYKRMGKLEAQEVVLSVTDGKEIWDAGFSVGDEVVVRANSKDLLVYETPKDVKDTRVSGWKQVRAGVYNRNSGRIAAIQRSKEVIGSYDVFIDLLGESPGRVVLNSQKFRHQTKFAFPVVHNFATTIYASQGQTVQKVFLVDSPKIESRLAYVGMSRHEESIDIYLDETELHQRMDKMIGRADLWESSTAESKEMNSQKRSVQLGRYRRAEMLQTIALAWSKQSLNLTVMMFDRDRKLGRGTHFDEKGLAELKMGSSTDPVIDFVPENNRAYPLVDLEKLLALDAPIAEEDFVSPSEIERRNAQKTHEESGITTPFLSPLSGGVLKHDSEIPALPSPAAKSPLTLIEKAFHWVLKKDESEVAPVEAPVLLKKEKPQKLKLGEIPFHPSPTRLGGWGESGLIKFGEDPQGVSEQMLEKTRGVWWDVGRRNEPRILARDRLGEVVSRYSLEGECVVGDGYPPMLINPRANEKTPIMIVPGAKEWLWTHEYQINKNADDPTAVPHLIWAAKDVDFQWVAPAMKNLKRVIIARSKTDDSQLAWALELQKHLRTEWGVEAEVRPAAPGAESKSEALPSQPEAARTRSFKRPLTR